MKSEYKKILAILIIGLLVFNCGCDTCQECANNLDSLIEQFTEYENGDIVEFINNESITIRDTAKIKHRSPEGEYGCWGSKEPSYECSGYYTLRIGDFETSLIQDDNLSNNEIYQISWMGWEHFRLLDTINNYKYKDTIIKVKYYRRSDTSFTNKDYYYYYMSFDNKLIEYGIKEGQIIEKWYLNE